MTTADVLTEQAFALAASGAEREAAVRELLERCGDRRVAVVRARQHVLERLERHADEEAAKAALLLLDEVLVRLPV